MRSVVGELVKKAREKKGFSQTKAGRLLRLSEQFVGRVEAGEVPLPLTRAARFQKVLDIKRSALLGAYIRDYADKVNKVLEAKSKRH